MSPTRHNHLQRIKLWFYGQRGTTPAQQSTPPDCFHWGNTNYLKIHLMITKVPFFLLSSNLFLRSLHDLDRLPPLSISASPLPLMISDLDDPACAASIKSRTQITHNNLDGKGLFKVQVEKRGHLIGQQRKRWKKGGSCLAWTIFHIPWTIYLVSL